jgi:hypothetical protein
MLRKTSGRFRELTWSGLLGRCWKLLYNSSLLFPANSGKQNSLPFSFYHAVGVVRFFFSDQKRRQAGGSGFSRSPN